jgi:hypothetical protein
MRTVIQPSHRTVCSALFSLSLSPQEGRKKEKKKKNERQTNGPSCACSEHAPKRNQREQRKKKKERKKKKKESVSLLFFLFLFSHHPFVLYRCGLCLKRSHTVLVTIHVAAAVVQHARGGTPPEGSSA